MAFSTSNFWATDRNSIASAEVPPSKSTGEEKIKHTEGKNHKEPGEHQEIHFFGMEVQYRIGQAS